MEGFELEASGILEIYVHHARNIHNICIYDNQDVYAKFSLTYNPDETISTRIVNGGGKNPDFNERLIIKVSQLDGAVLKCEIWMLSRARNYLEDQLLGFALVPISDVINKGKLFTHDYNLSSTDLFHSPAGTVRLSLSFNTISHCTTIDPSATSSSSSSSSISSEVVLLDTKIDPLEYSRIEFPDINVVRENQQMVSEYFDTMNSTPSGSGSGSGSCRLASLLRLGASSPSPHRHHDHHHQEVVVVDDYEMTINSCEDYRGGSISPNSGLLSSTTTSLSDERNTKEVNQSSAGACPDTPTSKKGSETNSKQDDKQQKEEEKKKKNVVFSGPLGSINNMEVAEEQTAMQQQIVDMYMRSMQQFTESLAKMKLPINLDTPQSEDDSLSNRDVTQSRNNKLELENKKKDGSRVFYGSRAFF